MKGRIFKTGYIASQMNKFNAELNSVLGKDFLNHEDVEIQYQTSVLPGGQVIASALIISRETI